jgi:hypothetical protein
VHAIEAVYGRFILRLGLMPPHEGDLYYVISGRIGLRENPSREWHFASIPVQDAELSSIAHRVRHWLAKEPARVADLKARASELYYLETTEELPEVGPGNSSSISGQTGEQFQDWLSTWERTHLSPDAQYSTDIWRWRYAHLVAAQQAFQELEAAHPELAVAFDDSDHVFVDTIRLTVTEFCEGVFGEELARYGAFVVHRHLGYLYRGTTYLFNTEEGAPPHDRGVEHLVLRHMAPSRASIHLLDWYANEEGVLEWESVREMIGNWLDTEQRRIHSKTITLDWYRSTAKSGRGSAASLEHDLSESVARYDEVYRALGAITGDEPRDMPDS